MYGCHMINFNYTKWFNTFEEALAFGMNSGYEFTIIDAKDSKYYSNQD